MAQSPVATDINKAFDVHLDFAAECAFHFVFGVDDEADACEFFVCPVFDFFVPGDAGFCEDCPGGCPSNSIDSCQSDFAVFIGG